MILLKMIQNYVIIVSKMVLCEGLFMYLGKYVCARVLVCVCMCVLTQETLALLAAAISLESFHHGIEACAHVFLVRFLL